MEPFDLEKAKAGNPVCTRCGSKARIICFDRDSEYPIVALIDRNSGEEISSHTKEGKFYSSEDTHHLDLFMIKEVREGFINIYTSDSCLGRCGSFIYKTLEEAYKNIDGGGYIKTVKIEL